jgi:tRNA G18 (ribose-2'-O)-methylase SpoU
MFRLESISSLDLPALQPYRTMRRQHEHRQQGIFVAEGEKVVRRLLESPFTVVSLLVPEKWFRALEPLLIARPELVTVFLAEKAVLESMTGFSMYQGLLAVGKIPESITVEELVEKSSSPALLVAADGLSSAENLGAVVRNCAAFGCDGLITGETSTSPFLRRAVRSGMGTIFQLPVTETASLVDALNLLRRCGFRCIAAHPRAGGAGLAEADFSGNCCIVLGSEDPGISAPVLAACDEAVAIPMAPGVDSLNVASAAAVFLYQASQFRSGARPPRAQQ